MSDTVQERIQAAIAEKATTLDLSDCELTGVPKELAKMVWLEELDLSNNQIVQISNLEKLTKLSKLLLTNNLIEKIGGLEGNVALMELRLDQNKITRIAHLSHLTALTRLDLDQNQLEKIEGLEPLKKLQKLYLHQNEINKIEGLNEQNLLTEFALNENKIEKIEGLDALAKLEKLYLYQNKITKIEGLSRLEKLTELSLNENEIEKIEGLDALVKLQELFLYQNKITKIEGLDKLEKLTKLSLRENEIEKIEGLDALNKLQILHLHQNKISKIEGLSSLKVLTEFALGENEIEKIEGLDALVKLQELFLYQNKITKIEGLSRLEKLTKLSLHKNEIEKIEGLNALVNLQGLYLYQNKITKIEGLNALIELSILEINKNKIEKIEGLDELAKLQKLHLHQNEISKIEGLSSLKSITELALSENKIDKIEGLDALVKLQKLHLQENKISEVEGVLALRNLTTLNLADNQISSIGEIISLSQLAHLYIENNTITDLSGIEHLDKLADADFSANKIENLLSLLTHIKKGIVVRTSEYDEENGIYVKDNPITNPPLEIVAQGNDAILSYWEQIEEEAGEQPSFLNEARILIVGEGEAGKTTLQRKLIDRNAKLPAKDNRTRKIIKKELDTVLPDGTPFKLHLWDFGGQNIQYYAHQFFLSADAIYLLVTDERRQSHNFVYWLHIIKLLGKDSPIFLLQNQKHGSIASSAYSAELQKHFPILQKERAVNLKDICDLQKPPADLMVTNSITLNSNNLNSLLEEITMKAAELPLNTVPRTRSFRKVRELVIAERKKSPYVDLKVLLNKEDAPERKVFIADLKTLSVIGECVYQSKDPLLRQYVFLNPQWIIDAMYRLIDNSDLADKRGQFTETEADEIWDKGEYSGMTVQLLRLLRHFYLCYQIPGTPIYIAPTLLPAADTVLWEEETCFRLYFEYQFLPYGILTRLICRFFDWIDDNKVWKDAVLLRMPDAPENTAYIRESFDQKQIILDAKGPESLDMVQRIREVLMVIHEEARYGDLQFSEYVPCPCIDCQENSQKERHRFIFVLKQIQQNKASIVCTLYGNDIPLSAFNLGKRTKSAFVLAHATDRRHVEELEKRLANYKRSGELELSSDRDTPLGQKRSDFITSKLSFADVVFVLLSPELLADNELYQNTLNVIERSQRQAQHIVMIRIAAANYGEIIEQRQCLPRDGSSMRSQRDVDQAWAKIVEETGGLLFHSKKRGRQF